MARIRPDTVPTYRWLRLADHLPPASVEAGDAAQADATVYAYRSARARNGVALEAALGHLAETLLDDLGSPTLGPVAELLDAIVNGASANGAAEAAVGMTPRRRAEVRRLAATSAAELAALLRRATVRAETLELGLTLRAEDLDADARLARIRPGS